MAPMISVVLPVFNECENLDVLKTRLVPILEKITDGSFEILFVDDGSWDGSADLLDSFHAVDPRLKAIHFTRNFGHQVALQAGLDEAQGAAVVLMDADLQDPPEILDQFIEKWQQGYQVVFAVRRKRKEGLFKRMAYALFYRSMKAIADIDIPLDAGDFCLLDRRVVDTLVAMPERNRFLRGLRSWTGFKQASVEYERDSRYAGEPKYVLGKLVRLALSGYIGFSAMPLRASAWLGLFSAAVGFVMVLITVWSKLMSISTPRGWASTVAIVLLMSGMQLIMLAVVGEYLSRVYDEVRQRPLYVVDYRAGVSNTNTTSAEEQLSNRYARRS
jgi:dolichol-phosphate mannosyltransferase